MKKGTKNLEFKKQKMMENLKKEINVLEHNIQNHEKIKNKRKIIKSLKIALEIALYTTPYVISMTSTFAGFCAAGITPFHIDENKEYLETKKEFDNFNNIKIEQQYKEYKNAQDTISHYGKWKNIEKDLYSREVKVYSLNKISEDEIIKLLKMQNISSLEEVFGKPIHTKIEHKNNLTEEEVSSNEILLASTYNKSQDEYIIRKETINENLGTSLLYIVASIVESIIIFYVEENSTFNIHRRIKQIKSQYESVDIENSKMKLKIKKDNYNRLIK